MMGGGHGPMFIRISRSDVESGYKLTRGTIPRALKLAARYRGALTFYVVVIVASSLVGAVPPLLLKALLDKAILPKRMGLVGPLAIAGVGVAIFIALTGLTARYFSARIGESLIYDLRVSLFDHVQQMPIAFFTRTQTGALISRLNNDVIGAQSALTGTLGTVVQNVITLTTTLVVMVSLSWQITLLAMLVLPLFLFPSKRVGKRLQVMTREQMNQNAEMNASMQERFNVSGAMLAKLFGNAAAERDRFSGKAALVRDLGIKIAVYMRTFVVTLSFVGAIGTAIVLWLGGRFAIEGALTVGTVSALMAYVGQLYMPLMSLTSARVDLMTSFVSFERVFEVLDLPNSIPDAPDAVDLPLPARGRIEFRDVRFRYPRADEVSIASLETVGAFEAETSPDEVLHGVSFVAEPGQTVALVGPSGAGKTTISNLIPRLFDATSGSVLVDGFDVRAVRQSTLRAAIGVVAQDPHLFHDTIRNNLKCARLDATDDELVEACKAAQIYDLIASLPDGFDTVVGERGYRLSGGEKQRLAIARVLLKRPAIVILDEATSHLDSESEVLIQRALDNALSNRTAVVIAHRLSTIVNADQILVVEAGRIAQRGAHHELVDAPGLYADLYRTQFARAATPSS
jgi:ATP-binding cassette subfamily B protein